MNIIQTIYRFGIGLLVFSILISTPTHALADSAAVLPSGISRSYADFYHYLPITQRYNQDGDREDLAFPFTDAPVGENVIPLLLPGENVGNIAVAYQYDIDVLDLGYSRGITDRLSVGFHIPYYWIRNNVDISLDNTNATHGFNPTTALFCDLTSPGCEPADIDDVQVFGTTFYGFSRIENWQDEGIGDIELGAKYQFFLKESSAFAITGGLRSPTGRKDDPDNLTDVPWSYGNYALLFRLHYDYLVSNRWKEKPTRIYQIVSEPGDFTLNTTFRYDYMLPDHQVKRVGENPTQVFTNDRERVSRKLGDLFNIEFSGKYQMTDTIAFEALYTYGFKLKDKISGSQGFTYESLETYTDSTQQIIVLRASYSTMVAYQEKKSRAPMEFSIAYRDRFAGDGPRTSQANPVLDTRWVVIGMNLLF